MAKGMDLLYNALEGECGFYGAAPCGTSLHEEKHRSASETPMAERVTLGGTMFPLL